MPDPLFETFLTSRGLNGLHQKGCHILGKNWIFYASFHKQWLVLLFWGQWWSDHQNKKDFWGNWALEAVEASEVAEAAEVNEAGEVSKAWKILTVDFRVFLILEFNNFRTNITLFWCCEKKFFWQYHENSCWILSTFSIGGRWGCMRSKKFQIVDQA